MKRKKLGQKSQNWQGELPKCLAYNGLVPQGWVEDGGSRQMQDIEPTFEHRGNVDHVYTDGAMTLHKTKGARAAWAIVYGGQGHNVQSEALSGPSQTAFRA